MVSIHKLLDQVDLLIMTIGGILSNEFALRVAPGRIEGAVSLYDRNVPVRCQ